MLKELQSLALDVSVLDERGNEIELKENVDYNDNEFRMELNGNNQTDTEDYKEGFSKGTLDESSGDILTDEAEFSAEAEDFSYVGDSQEDE